MNKDRELTEKLKELELEVYQERIDLRRINSQLEIAQDYETELLKRLTSARFKTKQLQLDFFKKSGIIAQTLDNITKKVEIFTGNFLRHFEV